ncbi:unnamed protein product, partial [Brugia timori]
MRGPTLFSGYWNAPEVNAHDFRGGWFHMGDLFVRRADGSLDFVDRVKYLIKSGGENIYPAEIERVLLAQPAVADAVVVRRRDERWGEVPVAFVAVQPGAAADGEPLLSRCREQLAGFKVPKEIRWPRSRAAAPERSSATRSSVNGSPNEPRRGHVPAPRHQRLVQPQELSMSHTVIVAGVGMIPFAKPGASEPYNVMGEKAARQALQDAGVDYKAIEQAFVGYVYGDSTCGQRALYPLGMTGIPVLNVNNNCSTGSSALFLARQAVQSGAAECVLALGFEQMQPGAIKAAFPDRPTPFEQFDQVTDELVGHPEIPLALRYFGGAGKAHMDKYGTKLETFAAIRAKASRHAVNNPLALFRKEVSVDDVMAAPMMWEGVMTRLMACPPTCGAAAA